MKDLLNNPYSPLPAYVPEPDPDSSSNQADSSTAQLANGDLSPSAGVNLSVFEGGELAEPALSLPRGEILPAPSSDEACRESELDGSSSAASPSRAVAPTVDVGDDGDDGDLGDNPGPFILTFITLYIRSFLVCDQHQLTVLALWSLYSWCFHAFRTAVYLDVRSVVPQSGKTRCLRLLELLCPWPGFFAGADSKTIMNRLLVSGRRLNSIGRLDELHGPFALLFDDCHHAFGPSERQPLLALLNSGADDSSSYTSGRSDYCVFGPKAFAGSAPLARSLAARCIPIVLHRKKPSDTVEHLPGLECLNEDSPLADFRELFKDWAFDDENFAALAEAAEHTPPQLPAGLSPAQQACAEPLLHLADYIGGDWPEKARAAIIALFDLPQCEPEVQILADVRNCFLAKDNPAKLSTRELLDWLINLDNRPWSAPAWDANSGRLLRARLRPFRISSHTLHVQRTAFKGYKRSDFQDVWERYLPPIPAPSGGEDLALAGELEANGSNQSVPDPFAPNANEINVPNGRTE